MGISSSSLIRLGGKRHGIQVSSQASPTLLLNEISAVPLIAISVRQLKGSGPVVRVINTDTNVQTDLNAGFTEESVNRLGAIDKIGVVKWYDQSGNGNDMISVGSLYPPLYYGPVPAINLYANGSPVPTFSFRSTNNVSVTAPKLFFVIDPILGTGRLSLFGSGEAFLTNGGTGANGNAFSQANPDVVEYNHDLDNNGQQSTRGYTQLTAWYGTGTDAVIRVNGTAIAKVSGDNPGTTAANNVKMVMGSDYGHVFSGSLNKYSECILCDGVVSTDDRDTIENNQVAYALTGKRVVYFGDSLMYGVNTGITVREEVAAPSAHTQALLGEGWDCYNRAVPGASLDNIDPASNLTTLAPIRILPLYRVNAHKNICVFWDGWNDMQSNSGDSAATFVANLRNLAGIIRGYGFKFIVLPPPVSNKPGQGSNYPTKRLAAIALIDSTWTSWADGYANFSNDPVIGTGADTANTDLWQDQLHMTSAGYALVAPYVRTAVQSV